MYGSPETSLYMHHHIQRDDVFGIPRVHALAPGSLDYYSSLKFTLTQGLPQEKLCALRQCVERILIDKPGGAVIVRIKAVPASTILEVEELAHELAPVDAVAAQ